MDIERAIGIIERVFTVDLAGTFALEQKQCIINLLKRGEKFEKILEETEALVSSQILGDTSYATLVWLQREMRRLKQKYFPKPKPKLIKLLAELDKAVKETLEGLGD